MFRLPGPHRFPDRLRALVFPADAPRVERLLARARTFLTTVSLFAVYLDPTEPARYAGMAYSLLVTYLLFGLVIMRLVRTRGEVSPGFRFTVHAADVLFPAVLTLFTQGPASPLFLLLVFGLLAAAYRWGFRETLATASATILVLFIEVVLISWGPGLMGRIVEGRFDINQLIIRSTYVFVMGILLGYLAEEEKQLRAESLLGARIAGRARMEKGLRASMQGVLGEMLAIFGAPQGVVAVEEVPSGRVFIWDARRGLTGQDPAIHLSELDPAGRALYFFPLEGHSWFATRRPPDPFEVMALDADGKRIGGVSLSFPTLPGVEQSFFAVSLAFGEEWKGRMFLFDPLSEPAGREAREAELRFMQTLIRQAGPALYNLYLLRRLRSRAGAIERARVARELHDGAIQSLTGVELEVDVMRRQAVAESAGLAEPLQRVQQLLRNEILNLREMMEQMKPIDLGPRELIDFLADTVEKFRRESGISASFVTELDEVAFPPRVGREVARIVQEALFNVRKHAGAANVLVRFASEDGLWKLEVDDDGRGFSFAGRMSQEELDAARKGPLVIKERVRAIGGRLAVESNPGRGARLEITLPRK